MYEQTLKLAGLDEQQATVYEVLLRQGALTAGALHKQVILKRTAVYKALDQLVEQGLAEKHEAAGTVTRYELTHPLTLKELSKARERELKDAQLALDGVLPSLISDFNLISGRPGIQFFEGLEGIQEALNDSIENNPDKRISAFSDLEGYSTYLGEWNATSYAPRRKRRGILLRAIIPNHEKSMEFLKGYQANEVTDITFLDHRLYPFKSEVNLYSNKVSIVTFSEKGHVGLIIDNREIFETFKSVFDFSWKMAKEHNNNLRPGWVNERY